MGAATMIGAGGLVRRRSEQRVCECHFITVHPKDPALDRLTKACSQCRIDTSKEPLGWAAMRCNQQSQPPRRIGKLVEPV